MVVIEVLVLAPSAATIAIIVVVFVSSIIVKAAAGPMDAFAVSGAVADELYAASITEGPSVHRSRTLAAVFVAVAIIVAGHKVTIAGALEASDGAAIEAAATITGLEEVAASTFSAVIAEEALATISSEVVAITFANTAWVIAVGFAELTVGQDRAGADHSQALALTPRKDHLAHPRRHTHHHSHLLRRSSHLHHRTTVSRSQHHQLEGLVGQFGHA